MKILNFKQDYICYMWRDNQIRMERNDLWGDPEENSGSILAYCQKFSETEESEKTGEDKKGAIAHVVYYYGQGGIGKSFVCREVARKLLAASYADRLYVVVVDLQRQKSFEDNLKCLADGIEEQLGGKDLFPRFHMAYYNYKMKKGEEARQEERDTKWDRIQNNDSFGLAANVAGLLTSFGTVSDVINLANDGYKWFLRMKDNIKYKALAHQIEAMSEKELQNQLTRYFAADFRENVADRGEVRKKKKKFAVLLDTVESMRYQALRRGDDEDYLEWLAGSDGLFRLMPDCFWLLFGREEIPWKKYDREWEDDSFVSKELIRPDETVVRDYLLRQLGKTTAEESCGTDDEQNAIIDEIIRQTEGYCLGIENCVDVYFRIWNRNLKENTVADINIADRYRPSLEEMREMLAGSSGNKRISARFLQYYTLQEREVLYTLVCLGTWTDEILENLIWKGMSNNILIYEEMCTTSFIHTGGDGTRSIQGLMMDAIMEDCAQRLKKRLLSEILLEMADRDTDGAYWLLFHSVVRIARFCTCDGRIWERLGKQFVRAAGWLSEHADFYELGEICGSILKIAEDTDEDLYNAVRIGKYFADVFRKEDAAETLELLRRRKRFGEYSLQIWKILQKTAWYAGCYGEAYEIAELLAERLSGQTADAEYYGILRQKVDLMQRLGGRFESAQIEEELNRVCELTFELAPADPGLAEKLNMRLWAEYHYNRQELWGETASQRIGECIKKYRECCTETEMAEDVNLCVMEIMRERAKRKFQLDVVGEWALKGLRILDKLYGDLAAEQPDMDFLFHAVITGIPMEREDRELYRFLFERYYKSFYKGGRWQEFSKLEFACGGRYLVVDNDYSEDGREKVKLSDIVERGILYLSNLSKSSHQNQVRLLLSYYLCSELARDRRNLRKEDEDACSSMQRYIANNRVLLYFLQKTLEEQCAGQENAGRQRVRVLLYAAFAGRVFSDDCFTTEEKRLLLSLFRICGLETDRAEWKAMHTGGAEGEEFSILKALRGWVWDMDPQADAQMAAALLSVAWRLKEPDLEKRMLELLGEQFGDINKRVAFWFALRQEARSEGGEWENHFEALFRDAIGREDTGKYNRSRISVETRKLLLPYRPELEEQMDARLRVFEGKRDTCEGEIYETNLQDRLAAEDYESMRGMIQEVLDGFNPNRPDERFAIAHFYMPAVKKRGLDGFVEGIGELARQRAFLGGEYFVLRAYAYLDDRDGFAAYYRENRQKIWEQLGNSYTLALYPENELYRMAAYICSIGEKSTIGEDGIAEDYCSRLADLYGSNAYGMHGYTERILYQLEWFAGHVPFKTIWRPARFTEEIDVSNYEEMYQLVEGYLASEELMDCFAAWGHRLWKRLWDRPDKADFSFFESEYYIWMSERFGKAFQDRMEAELPGLHAAKRDYEEYQKNEYLRLVNSAVCEIRSLADGIMAAGEGIEAHIATGRKE